MALYLVSLTAEGIQVTAEGDDQAERYARADARQFRADWDFQQADAELVTEAGEEPAEDADDASLEVSLTEAADDSDDVWTFSATFELNVEAESTDHAIASAKALLKGQPAPAPVIIPVANSHCHACGAKYQDEALHKKCHVCGTIHWLNPRPVAVLLQPVHDGVRRGVLIGLRGIEPQKNTWGLTGGFMETSDDGAEHGMVREYGEETRFQNVSPAQVGPYCDDPQVQLMFSGGSGDLDKPFTRQILTFGYSKRAIPIDALADFVPDDETLAIDVAWEPRELSFPLHTRALQLFFERYQDQVDWSAAFERNAA